MPSSIRRRSMGTRPETMVAERRPDTRPVAHQGCAGCSAIEHALVLRIRSAVAQCPPVSVRLVVHVSVAPLRAAGAAAANGPTDTRQRVSRDPGELLSRAPIELGVARDACDDRLRA